MPRERRDTLDMCSILPSSRGACPSGHSRLCISSCSAPNLTICTVCYFPEDLVIAALARAGIIMSPLVRRRVLEATPPGGRKRAPIETDQRQSSFS